jgi:hypothetical protein
MSDDKDVPTTSPSDDAKKSDEKKPTDETPTIRVIKPEYESLLHGNGNSDEVNNF